MDGNATAPTIKASDNRAIIRFILFFCNDTRHDIGFVKFLCDAQIDRYRLSVFHSS